MDRLVRALESAAAEAPPWARLEAAREVLEEERERLATAGGGVAAASQEALVASALERAARLARSHPTRVVNATGIVLHTNLGRAPLAPGAAAAVERAARSYGDLELDLETGKRGSRSGAVERKLCLLTGAGGAVAVNNNAAAVLLVLATLARDRAAVVSRGELIEIGGSFRVPDIMASAGVRLIEVGTTNRTHLRDYEAAIGPDTALLLKVHRSNFALRGFVAEVELEALAALAAERGIPLVEDLGSGSPIDLSAHGLPEESFAPGRLAKGADVVCFSGDKLLGGPQAGILLCRDAALADRMRRHPLARALRLDKLCLAALDWTLSAYLTDPTGFAVPAVRHLFAAPERLEQRAEALARYLSGVEGLDAEIRVEADRGYAGGGSLPDHEIASHVVVIAAPIGAERLAARLRRAATPVLARIRQDCVVLDMRTVLDGEEEDLRASLREALR